MKFLFKLNFFSVNLFFRISVFFYKQQNFELAFHLMFAPWTHFPRNMMLIMPLNKNSTKMILWAPSMPAGVIETWLFTLWIAAWISVWASDVEMVGFRGSFGGSVMYRVVFLKCRILGLKSVIFGSTNVILGRFRVKTCHF